MKHWPQGIQDTACTCGSRLDLGSPRRGWVCDHDQNYQTEYWWATQWLNKGKWGAVVFSRNEYFLEDLPRNVGLVLVLISLEGGKIFFIQELISAGTRQCLHSSPHWIMEGFQTWCEDGTVWKSKWAQTSICLRDLRFEEAGSPSLILFLLPICDFWKLLNISLSLWTDAKMVFTVSVEEWFHSCGDSVCPYVMEEESQSASFTTTASSISALGLPKAPAFVHLSLPVPCQFQQ